MTTAPVMFQNMPPLTPEEYSALEASILEHGILSPVITDENGVILDGHHRSRIAAEHSLSCPKQIVYGKTDTEKRTMALSMNLDRRHLNREQKRALVAESVKADPQVPDYQHAKRTGVSDKTVTAVRRELEAHSEIPNDVPRINARGQERPATYAAPASVNTETGEVEEPPRYPVVAEMTDNNRKTLGKMRDRKQERAEREASIVNDLRLYLRHIGTDKAITGMTPSAKRFVIEALEEAATNLKESM